MSTFRLLGVPLLARADVDRAEWLRQDPERQRAGWPQAWVLSVDPHGRSRLSAGVVGEGLDWVRGAQLGDEPTAGAVLLGQLDGGPAYWAVPTAQEFPEAESGDLRSSGPRLSERDRGLFTTAVALLNWHQRSTYCPNCGAPTYAENAGWHRRCSREGTELYPRTDPAIIVLVHDGGDRVLLGRQHRWPHGRYSVLAGFVETGESMESAVLREVDEEVGVNATRVHYLGSQPWPFPRSLMVAFEAVADPDQPLQLRDGEIAHARWFHRDEVAAALRAGEWTAPEKAGTADPSRNADGPQGTAGFVLPGSISVARQMLDAWVEQGSVTRTAHC